VEEADDRGRLARNRDDHGAAALLRPGDARSNVRREIELMSVPFLIAGNSVGGPSRQAGRA
jgi:hypothetical protein